MTEPEVYTKPAVACPFCGEFICLQELESTTVWDVFHNSCSFTRYLCLRCDHEFNRIH